jgi:hypothetical protein
MTTAPKRLREKQILIRVTEDEYRYIRKAAALLGMTMSALLRHSISYAIARGRNGAEISRPYVGALEERLSKQGGTK